MSKLKRRITIIMALLVVLLMSLAQTVSAENIENVLGTIEYSEDYKNWLSLPDDKRKLENMPRIFEVNNIKNTSNTFISQIQSLGASLTARYSLKDVIPENLSIRDQKETNGCWTFASLSSLETNLALQNKKNNTNVSKVYDYSERHMAYATSNHFINGQVNKSGYNKIPSDGGNYFFSETYLTNGQGAIEESEMPFENNEDEINISQIQNKTVTSQVYDTVGFVNYQKQTGSAKTEAMNEIKQHIQNHGAVFVGVYASIWDTRCYNNTTGALYCNDPETYVTGHAVSIIGWDDNYEISNFVEGNRPTSKGAWIVRNSWGEKSEEELSKLKADWFRANEEYFRNKGYSSADQIPDSFFEELGYTIANGKASLKIGDNGIIYISYEDCNVSSGMFGILKASDEVNYDNIYQYDDFYPTGELPLNVKKALIASVFDKKTSGKEYLSQVSLQTLIPEKCKVYVNPNGDDKSKSKVQAVRLQAGESENVDSGYHTLEFEKPIEITGNKFAVIIEMEADIEQYIPLETNQIEGLDAWSNVKIESGKCFFGVENNNDWTWGDTSKIKVNVASLVDGDLTIKAFTTNTLNDGSIDSITITTPPTKTNYYEGQNFDKTGMVVQAKFNRKNNPIVTLSDSDYDVVNGTNLTTGQTSVTISYQGKTATQKITVEKNSVTDLKIKTPPTTTSYKEGQNFNPAGMVVEATFKDGSTKTVTNYTVKDGTNLKANQTTVTIVYGEKTVTQAITVTPNALVSIKVTKAPNKTKYIVGEDFDKTGMVVTGTYQDNSTNEIKNYIVSNGTKLTKGQTSVTITFEGKSTEQAITVEESGTGTQKTVTGIKINKKPSKSQSIQNKEQLSLDGGSITVTYSDGSTTEVSLINSLVKVSGFNNTKVGKNTITVQYQNKTTTFDVDIVAEAKPVNSDFNNASCKITHASYYLYSDKSKKEKTLLETEINNVVQKEGNDSYEYYYYLSSSNNKTNIQDWVKISDYKFVNGSLSFVMNLNDINNNTELATANKVYIYIKEVAKKGGSQSIKISNGMAVDESKVTYTTYLNDQLYTGSGSNGGSGNNNGNGSNNGNGKVVVDNTITPGSLPKAGTGNIVIIIGIFAIVGIGIYIRYKKISKYIK